MSADVPRPTLLSMRKVVLGVVLIVVTAVSSFVLGAMTGWVRGYQEATEIQEQGWRWVVRTVDLRRRQADLERLLGRPVTEGCYETLFELDRPLPLSLVVERAQRETQCMTEAFKAGTEEARARRAPAKRGLTLEDVVPDVVPPAPELPAGQVRAGPIAWTSWRPSWLGGPPLARGDLLPSLKARFPRLDLVVEYPFPGDGAWVTLGGCLADGREARAARKTLYAVAGVAVVFDQTRRTPKEERDIPGLVDSSCNSEWMHDRRQVARWLMTPYRADDPRTARTLTLVKDLDHRARIVASLAQTEHLEVQGIHRLATALQEIHGALYRDAYPQTGDQRVQSLKMMFDVWARMPAPGKE